MANLSFDDAIRVGEPHELLAFRRDDPTAAPRIPTSGEPRGLALRRLTVTGRWDRLWSFLRLRKQIYFLSVAFDISAERPVVLPPRDLPREAVYQVVPGQSIEFTLGLGAPLFPPRPITGGLLLYITVCEADRGLRHTGEVLAQIHDDLGKDHSVMAMIAQLAANPAQTAVVEVMKAATAALQPVATILKSNQDDCVGLFSGIFPANGPWDDKLRSESSGTTIELAEL